MNQLVNDFQHHSISNTSEIESLCNQMINSDIEYDERRELYDFLELKKAGVKVIRQTDERYSRYLKGIDIWEIDGESYEYIRENIKTFLNIETIKENLITKLKLMRIIDKQLKEVIERID
jgi:hypothetical protein